MRERGAAVNELITAEKIIQSTKKHDRVFDQIPGLDRSKALCRVVQEYVDFHANIEQIASLSLDEYNQTRVAAAERLSYPAWRENPLQWLDMEVVFARQRANYACEAAEMRTLGFVRHIAILYLRTNVFAVGVSWDRKWKRVHDTYKDKQKKLAACLREAADIFDSGQCDPGPYASLTKYQENDSESWCGSARLREWANKVELSPLDVVFPIVRPDLEGLAVPFESIGTRGGASKPDSALRAMIVREIARYVPETIRETPSVVAELAGIIGVIISRQYVRSLLLGGRT